MNSPYDELLSLYEELQVLESLDYLLMWDSETYMPAQAIEFRSKQTQYIAKQMHQVQTGSRAKRIFSQLKDLKGQNLDLDQQAAVSRMQDDYEKAAKLPSQLVEKIAKVTAEATHVWAKAKKEDNFQMLLPYLETIFSLMQQKAEHLGYKHHPYDALVDEYEPTMDTKQLDLLFSEIAAPLHALLKQAPKVDDSCLYGSFDKHKQKELAERILLDMGHEPCMHRLDLSSHPFCLALCPEDVRMTTCITSSNFFQHLSATMHEGGHGLYEANINNEALPNPLRRHLSIAMHESQSKFWECYIGMSQAFWEGYYPDIQGYFPQMNKVSFGQFYQAINKVNPSLIRIYSDEVSYCLHIIIRYEIEKGIIDGTYRAKDLPDIWKEKMQHYLGITPPSDKEGCMQDIHWSAGLFGYFPTYALGCIYAAQFFDCITQLHPDYELKLKHKDLTFANDWLKEHVHKQGRRFYSTELIEKATGSSLSAKPFIHYLQKKHG